MISDKERIFAIGDIHGCYSRLDDLLKKLPYQPGRDLLVFIGDYINKGPDSAKVLDLICQLKNKDPDLITLMGNHEYLLMEYHRNHDQALLPYLKTMGIGSTLASYSSHGGLNLHALDFLPKEHFTFLNSLLPYWENDSYIFVHAGLEANLPLKDHSLSTLCESRNSFIKNKHDFGKKVIFGHTPFELPLVTSTKIGIDTGAVYGNLLTAIELPGENFFHA